MYITGTWFAAQMFSNDIIILIICRISCHLDFYKNWRSHDFKWRKSDITVLVFIDTLKRVQSCQRKVRATLTDRVAPNLLRTSFTLPPDKHHCSLLPFWGSGCCDTLCATAGLLPWSSPHVGRAPGHEPSRGRDTNSLSFAAITDGDCCANLNPLSRHYNFLAPSSVKWQRSLIAGFRIKHRLQTCSEWFRMKLCNCVNQEIVVEGILIVY